MEQIAFIVDHIYFYWSDLVIALAAAAAVCSYLALHIDARGKAVESVIFLPLAAGASLILSRLAQWYFRPESYGDLQNVWNLLIRGDAALMGAFAGCILAAALVRLLLQSGNLPRMLDCLSLAGGLGIGLGRLSSFFNTSDRGVALDAAIGLPWGIMTINPVSGVRECRLAVFLLQSMVSMLIFLSLLIFYQTEKKNENRKHGDTALLFLLLYGASQVVLDSMRYDSLFFRSNGFVSVVQVLSACAVAFAVIAFAVQLVKAGGWKRWYGVLWLLQTGCFGLAGYMEYYVQRHGAEAIFAYSTMSGALGILILLVLLTKHLAGKEEAAHRAWLRQLAEDIEG